MVFTNLMKKIFTLLFLGVCLLGGGYVTFKNSEPHFGADLKSQALIEAFQSGNTQILATMLFNGRIKSFEPSDLDLLAQTLTYYLTKKGVVTDVATVKSQLSAVGTDTTLDTPAKKMTALYNALK